MPKETYDLADGIVDALDLNQRANRMLIEALSQEAWDADPPGNKGRTIAAIAAHMHNVRLMWLKSVSPDAAKKIGKADRGKLTPAEALGSLEASHEAIREAVSESAHGDGRIKDFPRGVAAFVGYVIAHDSHHRGQICSITRQLGRKLPDKTAYGLWEWQRKKD